MTEETSQWIADMLANLRAKFLRTDEHLDALDLQCQHRAAADDVVADRGGDIGRIGRAAGPAQERYASDVFDDSSSSPTARAS
jgi:hypothetical protein